MNKEKMKERFKNYSLNIIKFSEILPKNRVTDIFARQLIRSGTSVGANYFAACRARSRAEFIAKMGIVEEEADETIYWLELLSDSDIVKHDQVDILLKEANEILSMVVQSIKTARMNKDRMLFRHPW
jgi:four helix bundle protein